MSKRTTTSTGAVPVFLSSIDQYVEINIVSAKEVAASGKDIILWGPADNYPSYLLDLYRDCATLHSIIDGTTDFIGGNGVVWNSPLFGKDAINRKGMKIYAAVRACARNILMTEGCAIQVIRSVSGEVAELNILDPRFVRSNKENTVFYYCEDFGTRKSHKDVIVYPAFNASLDWSRLDETERSRNVSSVLFIKGNDFGTYPVPRYSSAIKSCEIERNIDDYHMNSLENGFVSSAIVSMNQGVPGEEERKEFEKKFNEKFSGHQNAGRIMVTFADSKENAPTVETPQTTDFGEKYKALASTSRQKIFTAFRANPNLFGIPTENLGFSSEEYESAFKLYNRTTVKPIQTMIVDAFETILGVGKGITIVPFSFEDAAEQNVQ